MRRILISTVESYAEEYANCITAEKKNGLANWRKRPGDRLTELYLWLSGGNYVWHAEYIREILAHFKDIVLLAPDDFKGFDEKHFWWVDFELETVFQFNGSKKKFWELVVWAMNYEGVRDDVMPYYVKKMHLSTCSYCNAQYAITTGEDKDGRRWAMYQLDHFKPKSKYPYLCVSFFNLQPSCANCNQYKSTDEAEFNLYTDDKTKLEPLHFKFTPDDIIKFVTSGDEEIDVILDGEKRIVDSQKRLFKIDLVYKEHLDVAKEALVRMYINDKYYRKQLQASLDYLFPNGVEAPERFYWGNYLHPNEVHRRPLSMLIQDVVSFPWKGKK